MTRRILFATALLCAVFAVSALAGDISGNWTGTLNTGDEGILLTLTFKVNGEKLTGTVNSSHTSELPLNEGKIADGKISFYVIADTNGAATKYVAAGVVKDGGVTLTIHPEGGPDFPPVVLKRVQ
jgi:hypothetical protein